MTETLIQAAIYDATNTKHAALWDNYKKTGDVVLRNEIVLLYSNLVEIIVKKMYYVFAGKEQIEDVISNGMLTLIKAVESFDPSRGIKFDTYASIRIKGSVIDYIRAQDWVPRTVREKSKKIEEAYASLRENLFREPTYQEISDKLELSPEKVGEYLSAAHIYNMVSLEELLTDQMESFSMGENSNQGPQFLLLKKELSNVLGKAVDGLSEKERLVISLFYYEDLKIKDIAKIMEITPSRVSQIHSLALTKMKVKINEYFKA